MERTTNNKWEELMPLITRGLLLLSLTSKVMLGGISHYPRVRGPTILTILDLPCMGRGWAFCIGEAPEYGLFCDLRSVPKADKLRSKYKGKNPGSALRKMKCLDKPKGPPN
jgi:hypothetical protein